MDFSERLSKEKQMKNCKLPKIFSQRLILFKNSARLDFEVQARSHRVRGQKLDL
jgi:hypothetical protein